MSTCKNGHPQTPENVIVRTDTKGTTRCRVCAYAARDRSNARRFLRLQTSAQVPEHKALDNGYSGTSMTPNLQMAVTLADTIKSSRVRRGSFASIGIQEGKNPISLQEMEAQLAKRLKAVARYCDLVGIEIVFGVRKDKNV